MYLWSCRNVSIEADKEDKTMSTDDIHRPTITPQQYEILHGGGAGALVGYAQTNASFIFSQLSQSKDSQLPPTRPISGVHLAEW